MSRYKTTCVVCNYDYSKELKRYRPSFFTTREQAIYSIFKSIKGFIHPAKNFKFVNDENGNCIAIKYISQRMAEDTYEKVEIVEVGTDD